MVKCYLCEKSVEGQRTFACRRCRKSPLCPEHLDSEYKVCSGCAAEERIRLYNNLLNQERSVKGFLRFTQFIFILSALFFAGDRLFSAYMPEFLKENIVEYVYYWGGTAVVGMAFCSMVILSQKQKIKAVQDKIQSHTLHSRYMFR